MSFMPNTKHKSESVSKRSSGTGGIDRRVVQTRKDIDAAFVELLHRRSYNGIRVGDIARKAGVGRATFYAHYSSKNDLLFSQFSRIVAPMLALCPSGACPLDATAFFAHINNAPRIYRALMGPDGGSAPRLLRDCFEQRVRESLAADFPELNNAGGFQKAIILRFVAATLLSIVECWVESNAGELPAEIQSIFSKLVGEGLARRRLRSNTLTESAAMAND